MNRIVVVLVLATAVAVCGKTTRGQKALQGDACSTDFGEIMTFVKTSAAKCDTRTMDIADIILSALSFSADIVTFPTNAPWKAFIQTFAAALETASGGPQLARPSSCFDLTTIPAKLAALAGCSFGRDLKKLQEFITDFVDKAAKLTEKGVEELKKQFLAVEKQMQQRALKEVVLPERADDTKCMTLKTVDLLCMAEAQPESFKNEVWPEEEVKCTLPEPHKRVRKAQKKQPARSEGSTWVFRNQDSFKWNKIMSKCEGLDLQCALDEFDGCSGPPKPYEETMTDSCMIHDACYRCTHRMSTHHGQLKRKRLFCDNMFMISMIRDCQRRFCRKYRDLFARSFCKKAAIEMYAPVVRIGIGKRFEKYAKQSKDYCSHAPRCMQQMIDSLLPYADLC